MAAATLQKSRFWFYYLGAVWILTTGIPEYFVVIPLCLLGFVWWPAWGLASRINRGVFRWVLALQPWYRAEVAIRLPVEVERLEKGCLIVANHRSHLDVFMLFSEISHLRIVTKRLLFFLPLYGHMCFLLRMIPIARGSMESYFRAMESVRNGLRARERIHVFPEMTRCEPGSLVTKRFHTAPFKIAKEEGALVLPIAFWGTDSLWGKGSPQRIARGPCAYARSLRPVDPKDFASAEDLAKYVQAQIDQAVAEMASAGTSA